jgi:OmpA-OmpF porin, OOP family
MFDRADNKLVALIAPIGLVMGLSIGTANANPGTYLMSAGGDVVVNGAGECWDTVGGMEQMLPECGDVAPAPADADKDGVPDDQDKCPGTPAGVKVDAFGCPLDSDGDGVADYQDKCPGTPRGAKVDASGCQMMGAVSINVTADHFDFDSAKLKPAMKTELDKVASEAKGSPLEVVGYTDSTGPEAYNQMLSERRAQAAADYLEGMGSSNLTVKGMGENDPVASNATREGRAMNRRVEVHSK